MSRPSLPQLPRADETAMANKAKPRYFTCGLPSYGFYLTSRVQCSG
ncbi:hypothetical protein MED222_05460 [Vibrio sp. MED222]|nr:hypothetical protein MED222_05460 [Vibrio sp. MED222]